MVVSDPAVGLGGGVLMVFLQVLARPLALWNRTLWLLTRELGLLT